MKIFTELEFTHLEDCVQNMCGRLACGLRPQEVCNACCYKQTGCETFLKPEWRNFTKSKKSYKPSYNICPSEVAPVLLSGSHFDSSSRIIAPMVFGLSLPWGKTGSKHPVINCRVENIKTSNLFKTPYLNRQRCVVICNGFYEWQKKNKNCSTPFFISCEQPKSVLIDDPKTWNVELTKREELESFKVLKLAALFHVQNFKNEEPEYSFTIITKDASSKLTWLHPRMPAFVDSEKQLDVWLNCDEFSTDQALANLSQNENIIYYAVSNLVNRTRNKDISCIIQNKKSEKCEKNGANGLELWLKGQEKKINDNCEEPKNKKKKEI